MNNYSFWCDYCQDWVSTYKKVPVITPPPSRTSTSTGVAYVCPVCRHKLSTLQICHVVFFGSAYHPGLDKKDELCYTCDNRFKCYTGDLYV